MQRSCLGARLWMAFLGLIAACSTSQSGGSAEITLSLGNTAHDVRFVEYDIDCQDGVSFEGQMNVVPERDPPIWEAFVGLPVGPCSIVLTALGPDEQPICSGSTMIEVIANQTVKANVELLCPITGGDAVGNVDIDGRFSEIPVDVCPIIHFMTSVPAELLPDENEAIIQVRASDPDMGPGALSIELSADRGELTVSNEPDSVLICPSAGGPVEVTAKVSDGSSKCDQEQSVTVFCPAQTGLCEGVDCSDDNDCTSDVCTEGVCSNPEMADGTSCGSGSGSCQSGECVPGVDPCEGVDCSDGNDCTADFCSEGSCVNITVDDGASCQDAAGSCVAGDCVIPTGCDGVNCDDNNDCTADSCEAGVCSNSNASDGQLCDAGAGSCQSGDCVITDLCEAVSCDDGNDCTTDSCLAGVCANVDVANGTSCAGGAGTCEAGSCEPVDLCDGVSCSDGNGCTADVCTNGVCSNPDMADGTSCDGGSGSCQSGECVATTDPCEGVDCSDANECTSDVCTEGVCSNPNMADGTSCAGGSGTCQSGACESAAELEIALDAYCAKLVECNLLNADPDPSYGTVEACKQVDSVVSLYTYAKETGGACEAAVVAQWECYAENECLELVANTGIYIAFCEEPRLSQPEIDCPGFFGGF